MSSILPDSVCDDTARGNIDYDTDSFKVMLLTASATPANTWQKRSDVTNEVAAGSGYTAGGNAATLTVTKDTVNHREDITLGGTTWPSATFSARYAVYYKARGGASSADEIVGIIDFGSTISATAATFTLTASTLRFANQNP
jgi:hypothetical protein